MSNNTARWVNRTTPGAAPPPPSRAHTFTAPPPTIYPESSVSNPNASRYTGRPSRASSSSSSSHSRSRSRSMSMSVGPPPSSQSRHSGSQYSGSRSRTATPNSATIDGRPMQTYYAPAQQPIIARTSSADGKTSSYMIIPAAGQKVEILHPTPARSQTMPASSSSSSSSYYSSPTKEKPLIKRLFDKVEWSGSGSNSGKSSTSHSSRRSRRNSTGGSGSGTRITTASGSRVTTSSGTRITSGSGRVYEVTYV